MTTAVRVICFLVALACQELQAQSLDGYAFGCGGVANFQPGGPILAFEDNGRIMCPNPSLTGVDQCGSYTYDPTSAALSGSINAVGSFSATSLVIEDNILVSFQALGATCNVLALDYRQAFRGNAGIILDCPTQNPIPQDSGSESFEDNEWSFFSSGNVHFTSRLEQVRAQNTIRRDSFGVYVWDPTSERMRIYSGPWQGRPAGAFDATFTGDGNFLVDGVLPANSPCFVIRGQVQQGVAATPGAFPTGGDRPLIPGAGLGGTQSSASDVRGFYTGITTGLVGVAIVLISF